MDAVLHACVGGQQGDPQGVQGRAGAWAPQEPLGEEGPAQTGRGEPAAGSQACPCLGCLSL